MTNWHAVYTGVCVCVQSKLAITWSEIIITPKQWTDTEIEHICISSTRVINPVLSCVMLCHLIPVQCYQHKGAGGRRRRLEFWCWTMLFLLYKVWWKTAGQLLGVSLLHVLQIVKLAGKHCIAAAGANWTGKLAGLCAAAVRREFGTAGSAAGNSEESRRRELEGRQSRRCLMLC